MTTLQSLIEDGGMHVHDPQFTELTRAEWLVFARSASQAAQSSGWLLYLQDDESISLVSNTYEYAVPANFAYIYNLEVESSTTGVYIDSVPRSHWEIRIDSGVPNFKFETITLLTNGRHLRITGQKRPTIYSGLSDTVDNQMEGYVMERMLFYAFRYLANGQSDLARWRQQMSQQSWQISEAMLRAHPQEFRVMPSGILVKGR